MITEDYRVEGTTIRKELRIGERVYVSKIIDRSSSNESATPWSRWWRSYLRGARPTTCESTNRQLTIVDLFCGCGGLTLGVSDASRAAGIEPSVLLAVDTDEVALSVYCSNHHPARALHANVGSLVEFQIRGQGRSACFAFPPEAIHEAFTLLRGRVNLLIAGPPCQGHSNLNNWTRRSDPRNLLYLEAIAAAVAVDADAVIIENVPDVVNDKGQVVDTAIALLKSCGYYTSKAVLAAHHLGFAQTRRRFFLVASRKGSLDLDCVAQSLRRSVSDVRWAIEDLEDTTADEIIDSVSVLSAENRLRIDYLFDNNRYELPDNERPKCHRNGHTYPAVYGRLKWDMPSGTITTGFVTPGRGRYIHPSRRRTITPREAARLQGFPDYFLFRSGELPAPTKGELAKWIGDAVPPILGYVAALAVIPGLVEVSYICPPL
jgi:DNA (cytosine-5)-methyltransferase 1